MFKELVTKVVGTPSSRLIKQLQPTIDDINDLEEEYRRLSDEDLRNKTAEFRERFMPAVEEARREYAEAEAELLEEEDEGLRRRLSQEVAQVKKDMLAVEQEALDELLPEAFAAVREASRRTIGLRHFDVQLLGGMVLHRGKVAEMRTGEGKTLVASLPLYLNAIAGRGAHLVTVNDYLARRDGGWMGPVYHALGMSVGVVVHDFSARYDPAYIDRNANLADDRLVHWVPCTKAEAYNADITYGTNNEFGFDYLRDNMVWDKSQMVQRELHYAIVDEVDNILIDEARTPLIISGPAEEPSENYKLFARLVRNLRPSTNYDPNASKFIEQEEPNGDYVLDEKTKTVTLTDRGVERIERALGIDNLYAPEHVDLVPYLDNALRAQVVYHRDREYVVSDQGEIIIVDEHTGRLMYGRRFSEGLHQAIEAKEGVEIQRETLTHATITFQNFFRMYNKLAGMTGTAETEQEEFFKIYALEVVVLPTNVEYRAMRGDLIEEHEKVDGFEIIKYRARNDPNQIFFKRSDYPDVVWKDLDTKFRSVVDEIKELNEQGRPVLVGTVAVETSEHLSQMLKRERIPHNVLNAKKHEQEAFVIAQAGRPGAVTIATNMAGRGVDILLGGNPENLAADLLQTRFYQAAREYAGVVLNGNLERARQIAESTSGLAPDMDTLVQDLAEQYSLYHERKAKEELVPFLTRALTELEGKRRKQEEIIVRPLVEAILADDWPKVRSLIREGRGLLTEAMVDEVKRQQKAYEEPADAIDYVANQLFNRYYSDMLRLIHLVLDGKLEDARRLVAEQRELNESIIAEIQAVKDAWIRDRDLVRSLGGLHVLGTERFEARRIDNQLRGRAGRQGDRGSSRFHLSLDDELMRRFGGERVKSLMKWAMQEEDVPVEHRLLDKTIEQAQVRVEGYNFDMRKHVLEYDDVVNKQREVIYAWRRKIIERPSQRSEIEAMLDDEIEALVEEYTAEPEPADWDLAGLQQAIESMLPWRLPPDIGPQTWSKMQPQAIIEQLSEKFREAYDLVEQELTPEAMRQGERMLLLSAIDSHWVRHLTNLDALREGIGLRAYGQQDPLVAYKKEAFETFAGMMDEINSEVARHILRLKVIQQPAQSTPAQSGAAVRKPRARPDGSSGAAAGVSPAAPPSLVSIDSIRRKQRQLQAGRQAGTVPAGTNGGNAREGQPASTGRPGGKPQAEATNQAATPQKGLPARVERRLGPNDDCWCGSKKKYKKCHMASDREQAARNQS